MRVGRARLFAEELWRPIRPAIRGTPRWFASWSTPGADAKKINHYGVPPLAKAARIGNLEMCEVLLKTGADPDVAPGGFGRCEGIYAQQVGTVSLDLRSFVKGFGPFDPAKDSKVMLG